MSQRYSGGFITASYNGLKVPDAPTIGTATTAGSGAVSVTFTAPANTGGGAITGYTVTSSPGGVTGTGASSPVTVSGLTNGTAYTFTVAATNIYGTGASSAASNSVTPVAGVTAVNYLVVAGGGGASASGGVNAGGGGAGGFRSGTSFAVSGSFTVTVGAGGAGQSGPGEGSGTGSGTQGSSSVFSTITSAGGGAGTGNAVGPNAAVVLVVLALVVLVMVAAVLLAVLELLPMAAQQSVLVAPERLIQSWDRSGENTLPRLTILLAAAAEAVALLDMPMVVLVVEARELAAPARWRVLPGQLTMAAAVAVVQTLDHLLTKDGRVALVL